MWEAGNAIAAHLRGCIRLALRGAFGMASAAVMQPSPSAGVVSALRPTSCLASPVVRKPASLIPAVGGIL